MLEYDDNILQKLDTAIPIPPQQIELFFQAIFVRKAVILQFQ